MSNGNPPDPAAADRQLDLFDDRHGRGEGEVVPPPYVRATSAPPVADLTDDALIAMLPQAGRANVEALTSEVVSRSLTEAVPALEALWRRFSGFGVKVPYLEQRAVLGTLARLEDEAAREALGAIVLSRELPASLLPAAACAAAEAGLGLPAAFVAPLLGHEEAAVREAAYALAVQAGIGGDGLRDGLTDPSPAVRRLAAIAVGMRGDAEAMEHLVDEAARHPSAEVIEALAAIGDDDAIVHLGRCAERHPAFADTVVAALRELESTKAERLVSRLEAARPRAAAPARAIGDGKDG